VKVMRNLGRLIPWDGAAWTPYARAPAPPCKFIFKAFFSCPLPIQPGASPASYVSFRFPAQADSNLLLSEFRDVTVEEIFIIIIILHAEKAASKYLLFN
jgi:hypothetical protein